MIAVLAKSFNYTQIPDSAFDKEPVTAAIFVALTFTILFTHVPAYLFAHLPVWLSSIAHNRFGAATLIAISIPMLQQLTYLIPLRIPSAVRWVLAIATIAAITALHVNLLWIVPTLVWTFLIGVFLLRALMPSVSDHHMGGYLEALARPYNFDSYGDLDPNSNVYRWLGLS